MRTNAASWALVSGLALAGAGLVLPASAADESNPLAAETVATWTGLHAGVGGGAGDAGGFLTGEAGFDFQLGDHAVLGITGDYARGDFDDEGAEFENMWTVAGRSGFLSSPQTLWYGLAGWTYAGNDDLDGIGVGLGVESVLSGALSMKLEYRHTEFDGPDPTVQSVRGVISWRFTTGWPRRGSGLSVRRKTEFRSGCVRVLRAPEQYSGETVELCEIANSL